MDAGNLQGVILIGTHESLIESVSVSNSTVGMTLYASNNNIIRDYNGTGNHVGLVLSDSDDNLIDSPFFDGCRECLHVSGSRNIVTQGTFLNCEFGVSLRASFSDVTDSYFAGGGTAVMIPIPGGGNRILRNTMEGNRTAYYGWKARRTTVAENTMRNNTEGVYQAIGHDNVFSSNLIEGHEIGIRLLSSTGNLVYNNMLRNVINAEDTGGSTTWSTEVTPGENIIGGPFLAGNYWSDYAGADLDGDGIGDTDLPHDSSGHITDGGDGFPLVGEHGRLRVGPP